MPPQNLLPVVASHTPSGEPLQLNFKTRSSPKLMDELGEMLLQLELS